MINLFTKLIISKKLINNILRHIINITNKLKLQTTIILILRTNITIIK